MLKAEVGEFLQTPLDISAEIIRCDKPIQSFHAAWKKKIRRLDIFEIQPAVAGFSNTTVTLTLALTKVNSQMQNIISNVTSLSSGSAFMELALSMALKKTKNKRWMQLAL